MPKGKSKPKKEVKKPKKAQKKTIKKPVVAKAKEVKAPKVMKLQDEKYWANRKIDDGQRDWGTDANSWLNEYWGSQSHPHRQLIVDSLFEIQDVTSILEVGCNVGANLNKIHDSFPNMTLMGLDVNADAIKFASSLIGGSFVVGSASKIPKEDKSVDVVLTDAVLIYSDAKEVKKQLKEITRVAKKAVILVEWVAEKEGVVDKHYARNYPEIVEKLGFELTKVHKITETEWPSPKWFTQGYLFVFQAV